MLSNLEFSFMAQENGASSQTDNVSSSRHISGLILRSSKLLSRKAWLGCTRASRPRSYDLLLVAEYCCWVSGFFSALLLRLTMGGQWWKRCLLCSGTTLALPMSNWLMCVFAYARDLFPMQFCHFWPSSSIVRSLSTGRWLSSIPTDVTAVLARSCINHVTLTTLGSLFPIRLQSRLAC